MSDDHILNRRTLLGATAALGIGSLSTAAGGQEVTAATESAQTADLSTYANRAGRISSDGLDDAFDDWGNGDITDEELDAVIDAWSEGERVVDYEVQSLGDIVEDTTLERAPDGDAVVYQATSDVDVEAHLEIEPGVAIEFEEGVGLDVDGDDGSIIAEGTDQEPILLTATNPLRGWWDGIRMASDSLENVLEYVTVEYGGRGESANIRGTSGGEWDFSNCRIRRSGEYGIMLDGDDVRLREAENNTYAYNVTAAHAGAENVHGFDSSSQFVDNDNSYVFVRERDGFSDYMDIGDFTWDSLEVPYRLRGGDRFAIDVGTWTIEAGTTIKCEEGVDFVVTGSGAADWRGDAPDEEDDADWITFTATQQDRGWWDGINISSDSVNNALEYVTVEYGGNPEGQGANIRGSSGGAWDFSNCRIRHSGAYGIMLDGDDVRLREAQNNTYANNVTAAHAGAENVHGFDSSSQFVDNDNSYVFVRERDGSSDYMDIGDFTWENLDVPYRLRGGDRFAIDVGTWTIEAGTTIKCEEGVDFVVTGSGAADWRGDAPDEEDDADWITFTATQQDRGWWDGINISSDSVNNALEYVTVEYGGNPEGQGANIRGSSGGAWDFSNCRIRHSGEYGIMLDGDDVRLREAQNNTYANNVTAAHAGAENVHGFDSSSQFVDNDNSYVFVRERDGFSDYMDIGDFTWDSLEVPYRLRGGDVFGIDGGTWTIEPGAVLEIGEGVGIFTSADEDVAINFAGTEEEEIVFTGTEEIRGWWYGIGVYSDSLVNTIEHATIEYGGRLSDPTEPEDDEANVRVSGQLNMTDSTLRESGWNGAYDETGANADICTENTFENNENQDCVVDDN